MGNIQKAGIVHRLKLVILALVGVRNSNKHLILKPVQLGTQRVPNWLPVHLDTTEINAPDRIFISLFAWIFSRVPWPR